MAWRGSGLGRFCAGLAVLGAVLAGCASSPESASSPGASSPGISSPGISSPGISSPRETGNAGSILAAVSGDACGQLRDAFGRLHGFFNAPIPPAERYRDPASGPRAMQADLAREAREIEHATQIFFRLRECRWAQAQSFRGQLRGRPLMRMAARQRMMFQRDRFQEELAVADRYRGAMQNRDQAFQGIAQRLAPAQPAPTTTITAVPASVASGRTPPPARPTEATVTESVPEKRNSFAAAITSARAQSQAVFNLDDMPAS